jgi:hypothetical protein
LRENSSTLTAPIFIGSCDGARTGVPQLAAVVDKDNPALDAEMAC